MDGQRVDIAFGNGQLYLFLYHAKGDGGIVDTVDILWFLVQITVEIDAGRLASINGHIIDQTTLVEEVEG